MHFISLTPYFLVVVSDIEKSHISNISWYHFYCKVGLKTIMFTSCIILLTSTFLSISFAVEPTTDYPHSTFLDPEENYQLFWKYDENTITFEVGLRPPQSPRKSLSPLLISLQHCHHKPLEIYSEDHLKLQRWVR